MPRNHENTKGNAEAQQHAETLAADTRLSFVHPFDDPLVIAGQGTVAVELLRQSPEDRTAVFVPVGGGGLIAAWPHASRRFSLRMRGEIKPPGVAPQRTQGTQRFSG